MSWMLKKLFALCSMTHQLRQVLNNMQKKKIITLQFVLTDITIFAKNYKNDNVIFSLYQTNMLPFIWRI